MGSKPIQPSSGPHQSETHAWVASAPCSRGFPGGGMFGAPAFVTQNGEAVNLTTETGVSYRAWPDWSAPDSRIWIDARNEGAVYSPDGMRIQFDDGRVWQRDVGPPPVVMRRAPVIWRR